MEDQSWNESDVEILDGYLLSDIDLQAHGERHDSLNNNVTVERTAFCHGGNDDDDVSDVLEAPLNDESDESNLLYANGSVPPFQTESSLHLLEIRMRKLMDPTLSTWNASQLLVQGCKKKRGVLPRVNKTADISDVPFSAIALGPAPVLSTVPKSDRTNGDIRIHVGEGGTIGYLPESVRSSWISSHGQAMLCEREGMEGVAGSLQNGKGSSSGATFGPSPPLLITETVAGVVSYATSPTHIPDRDVSTHILARRERNRRLARRARERKQAVHDELLSMATELYNQNKMLKAIIQTEMKTADSQTVLSTCHAVESVPDCVLQASKSTKPDIEKPLFDFVESFQRSQRAFVITDPTVVDNPIIFASADFIELTGYTKQQICGRNCRFLQGPLTSRPKVKKLREALRSDEDVQITLVNYKADGTPFWNNLHIAGLRDAENTVLNYIGLVVMVASPPPGDPEFGKEISHNAQN